MERSSVAEEEGDDDGEEAEGYAVAACFFSYDRGQQRCWDKW